MTWAAAMSWGESLLRTAGQTTRDNEEENQQVKRVIEIADWVQHWADQSFGLRPKREDNTKVIFSASEDVPHLPDQKLYELAYAEFHPTTEALSELVSRHSTEEVANNIGVGEEWVNRKLNSNTS